MVEISVRDIFKILLRKWWIVIICITLTGVASYIWTNYYTTEMYSASTTLYVGKNTDAVGVQTADLNLGSNLILDYREIAKSRRVAYVVIDELGLKTSARAMSNRISVNQRDMTRVIEISVSDVNPQMAMDITNKVAEVFQSKVKEIMQIENVQIIDKAEMPMYPVSPNKQMNYLLGIIIGLVIGVGIIFLIAFLDDTIKTPDDVQRHVELSVIGAIPAFQKIGRRA